MGKYEMPSGKRFPMIAVTIVIIMVIVNLLIFFRKDKTVIFHGTEETDAVQVEKNANSIAIPGYEGLELIADKRKQTLCLPNPAQNACYFQISLYLEDGTLLWESELIEPGELSKPIKLSMTLEKGSYPNSVLHYACFAMDGSMTPLNGAEMKLTLRVK